MKKISLTLTGGASLSENGLYRVEVIRCGRWDYPKPGEPGFEITPSDIRELHDNFKAGVMGKEVPLNVDHEDGKDCGWLKDVSIGNGGRSLYGFFEVTKPDIKELVDQGTLKYASAELDFERQCPEMSANGVARTMKVLEGLALTNHPYVKRMDPVSPVIQLSDRAALNAAGVHFPSVMDGAGVDFTDEEDGKEDMPGAACAETQGGNMPEITLSELQKENEALKAKLTALEQNTDAKAALAEAKAARADLSLRDTEDAMRRLVRRGKVTPAIATRALRLAEVLIKSDSATIKLSAPVTGRKYTLAEGEEDSIDKLDVIGEVIDMLGQLPDAVAMDPSQATLAEEDGDMPGSDDDEEALMKKADEVQASEPKLSRREAYAKARKLLAERKGGK